MNPFSFNAQLDHGRVILTLNKALHQVASARGGTTAQTREKETDLQDKLLCFAYHEDVMDDIQHLQQLVTQYLSSVPRGQYLQQKKQSFIKHLHASIVELDTQNKSKMTISDIEKLLFGPLHRYHSSFLPEVAAPQDNMNLIETIMYNTCMLMEPSSDQESKVISLFILLRTLKNDPQRTTWNKCGFDSVKELQLWHTILTQKLGFHQAGIFRKSALQDVIGQPAHHLVIEKVMNLLNSVVSSLATGLSQKHLRMHASGELEELAADKLRHAFAMAAFVHYHFMDIQPFYEGNQVLARVLAKSYLDFALPLDIPMFDDVEKYVKIHSRLYQPMPPKANIEPTPASRQRTLSTTSLQFHSDKRLSSEEPLMEYPYDPLQQDPAVSYADHLDTLSMHESIDQLYQDEFTRDNVEFESPLFAPLPVMKALLHSAIRHFTLLLKDLPGPNETKGRLFDQHQRIVTAISSMKEFKQLVDHYAPQCSATRFELLSRVFESMDVHTEMDFDLVGAQNQHHTVRVAKYPNIQENVIPLETTVQSTPHSAASTLYSAEIAHVTSTDQVIDMQPLSQVSGL